MQDKIRSYVDGLFAPVIGSREAQELHDEILSNTLDRYEEEQSAGKSPREAYAAAVAAIGDTGELLSPFRPKAQRHPALRAAAVALYVLCILPLVLSYVLPEIPGSVGLAVLLVMAAAATSLLIWSIKGSLSTARLLRGTAVGLLILSAVPMILTEDVLLQAWGEAAALTALFVLIAAALVLLVIAAAREKNKEEALSPEQEVSDSSSGSSVAERVLTLLFWIAAAVGFCIAAAMGYWRYAWLLFPLAAGITTLLRGLIRLLLGRIGGVEGLLQGLVGLISVGCYWELATRTDLWLASGLIFAIAGCLQGVISGICILGRGGR